MTPQANPHAEFPLGPFRPHEGNPILRPQGDTWESASVYNPAAIVKDDQVVLLYRAHADDIVSYVGLANSADGIQFERHPDPVLSPTEDYEKFGAEDPRVSEIEGTYYLTYTGWNGKSAQLCLATSTDLFSWTKHGPQFPDYNTFLPVGNGSPEPWSKAGGILPEPINGRYLMYFGEGSIWYAWSDDLIHWTPGPNDEPIMTPTPPGTFGSFLVEVGPPPIITNNGLILLLHNAAVKNDDGSVFYTCGQLLFSPEEPTRILAQMNYPWLAPQTYEDTHGLVSNVTFVEGLVFFRDTWFAYYGQSDSTLGVATYQVGDTYGSSAKRAT
jgi:beta-1,2-mannosidase